MKCLKLLFAILALVTTAKAQTLPTHNWTATVVVVDELGQPVTNANVKAIYSTSTDQGKAIPGNVSGLTDSDGVFRASHAATGDPRLLFRVTKSGYYESGLPYDMGFDYTLARWKPELQILMKKIGNPIPMFAKQIDTHPPEKGKPVGFDLEIGDWVSPLGKGKSCDIIFQWDYVKRSRLDYNGKLTVSFPNAGDGIQLYSLKPEEEQSELHSPHTASPDGYIPKVERVNISTPGQTTQWDYDSNRKYFFRVHTVLDSNGKVTSALYGKIYGDFMHFTYYLNPTPNDLNMEFDPNHNLLPGQNVTRP